MIDSSSFLLIRCDDIGMCHSVNVALQMMIASGIPFSASIITVGPMFDEGVAILKEHPEVSVGVHLTLNAEWKGLKWGPLCGAGAVPTLVDSLGNFLPSTQAFLDRKPETKEIEEELRAQIQKAIGSGLKIDYVDFHMWTAVATDEYKAIVTRLAAEYHLGMSHYSGECDAQPGLYPAEPEHKTDSLIESIRRFRPGTSYLLISHPGLETDEMNALIDENSGGKTGIGRHRYAELRAITSPEFQEALDRYHVIPVTYRDHLKTK